MRYKVGSKVEHPKYGRGVIFYVYESTKEYLMKSENGYYNVKESDFSQIGLNDHADDEYEDKMPSSPADGNESQLSSGDTIYHYKYGHGLVTEVNKRNYYIRVKFKYNTIRYFRLDDKNLFKTSPDDSETTIEKKKTTARAPRKNRKNNDDIWKYKVGDTVYNNRLGEGKVTQIMRSLEAYTVKFGTKAFFMRLDGSIPDLEKEHLDIHPEALTNHDSEAPTTTIATSDGLIYEGTTVMSFSEEELRSCVVLDALCTSIGEYAFSYCEPLCSIVIPSSVKSIGEGAFSGCSSLTLIVLKGRVTDFGADVFTDCKAGVVVMCFDKDVEYYKSALQLTEPRFIPFDAEEKKDRNFPKNDLSRAYDEDTQQEENEQKTKTKHERPIYTPPKYMRDDDKDDAKSNNRTHTSIIDWLSSDDNFDVDKTDTSNNDVDNKTSAESVDSDDNTQSDHDESTIRFGSDRININSEANKKASKTESDEKYGEKDDDPEESDTDIKINAPVFHDDSIDEQYFAPIQNLDRINNDGNSRIESIYKREIQTLSSEAQAVLNEHFPQYSQIEDIQEGGYYPDFSEFTEDFMICNELEKFCDHMSFLVQGIKVGR
jgi:hypothetical protein